jgi:predicted nuclease of predicted toxin-antitoxin system
VKVLLDMNLPVAWVEFLATHGIDAVHWSTVGDPRAPDAELMTWARTNGHMVFTHDLDFSVLLASTRANGPSVLQVRTLDVTPAAVGNAVIQILTDHAEDLERGAIVTFNHGSQRVRLLPIRRDP